MSTELKSSSPSRIYYLDYLRAFVVFIVIIHHSLLPYVIGCDWMVNDTKTFPYTAVCVCNDEFMMPLLFFIAGYFAFPSIRKGIKYFICNKIIRILLPFFIGVTFLSPIITYLGQLHHGVIHISYSSYWFNIHLKQFMNPQHYWFLSLLFFLFMIFAIIYYLAKDKLEAIYQKSKLQPMRLTNISLLLILFFALSILLFYYAGRKYPDGSWYGNFKFIAFQVTRTTGYVLYFFIGIFAFIKQVHLSNKCLKFSPAFVIFTILSTFVFIIFKFQVYYSPEMGFLQPKIQFFHAIIHVLYCFIICLTLLVLFKKYMNYPSKILSKLAANSYTVYIVHMVYVVFIQYYIVNIQLSIFPKFISTSIASIIISLVTSGIILKLLPTSPFAKLNKFLTLKNAS